MLIDLQSLFKQVLVKYRDESHLACPKKVFPTFKVLSMNTNNVFIVYNNDLGRVEVEEERIYVDMLTKDHFFEILYYISFPLLN